jgi:hypothetical protein
MGAPGNLCALAHSLLDDALAERKAQAVCLAGLAEAALSLTPTLRSDRPRGQHP